MIDINELRRLAQAATQGRWKVGQYLGSPRQFVIHMDVGDKGRGSDIAFASASFDNDTTIANARLIAAANPAAIKELLDRLEAAEASKTSYKNAFEISENTIRALTEKVIPNIREKLEAAEMVRDLLRTRNDFADEVIKQLTQERDVLQEEAERVKQQEPVAWATKLALRIGKDVLGFQVSAVNMWGENGVALYLAPGAQGENNG
jgi:hypothetical protein